MMDLKGKKVLVYGLGKTGIAAARFLAEEGAVVRAVDDKPPAELESVLSVLKDLNIHCGNLPSVDVVPTDTELVVSSPGIPPSNLLLQEAESRGIPVISEIELAFPYISKPIIAITGTNGKTTTTELIGHMLKRWGKEVFLGGNLGTPLITFAGRDTALDYLVVEVSSFQLQRIDTFRPRIAVLLNMGSDHLDYHGSLEEYRAAKERLFENMGPGDLAVLNADDPFTLLLERSILSEISCFSSTQVLEEGIFVDGSRLRFRRHGSEEEEYSLEALSLRGRHNLENVMAGILVARHCGCPGPVICESLESFRGLPHRMEFVAAWKNVQYFDDSKGTNVDAVIKALESFTEPLVLLMGGRDKHENFNRLLMLIGRKVRELILFGEAGPRIAETLGGIVPTRSAETLGGAVEIAMIIAHPGDVVLLSPGCTSFDEFANYEERGNFFKNQVLRAMKGTEKSGRTEL